MNADTVRVQRLWQGVTRLVSSIFANMLCSPFPFRPLLEGEHQNDYALACRLAAEANNHGPPYLTVTHTPLLISEQSRRSSHSSNSFYTRRRVTSAFAVFFFNVNIVNFFQEFFPSNLIFAPLLTILLSFLQIGSSGTNPSPFEHRPAAFMVSLGCSVAYYLTLAAKFMFPGFASLFGILASIFGSLAVATLISLALQLPWWSILFILTFMGAFFKLINKLHRAYGFGLWRDPHLQMARQHLPLAGQHNQKDSINMFLRLTSHVATFKLSSPYQ